MTDVFTPSSTEAFNPQNYWQEWHCKNSAVVFLEIRPIKMPKFKSISLLVVHVSKLEVSNSIYTSLKTLNLSKRLKWQLTTEHMAKILWRQSLMISQHRNTNTYRNFCWAFPVRHAHVYQSNERLKFFNLLYSWCKPIAKNLKLFW